MPHVQTEQQNHSDVINIDYLVTAQCSAGKPWVLAFMWMPLDIKTPIQSLLRIKCKVRMKYSCHERVLLWQRYSPMAVLSTSRTISPDTRRKMLRNGLRSPTKISRCCAAGRASVGCVKPSLIYGGTTTPTYRTQRIHYKSPGAKHQAVFGCTRGTCTIVTDWCISYVVWKVMPILSVKPRITNYKLQSVEWPPLPLNPLFGWKKKKASSKICWTGGYNDRHNVCAL